MIQMLWAYHHSCTWVWGGGREVISASCSQTHQTAIEIRPNQPDSHPTHHSSSVTGIFCGLFFIRKSKVFLFVLIAQLRKFVPWNKLKLCDLDCGGRGGCPVVNPPGDMHLGILKDQSALSQPLWAMLFSGTVRPVCSQVHILLPHFTVLPCEPI
uniref:Uncharacterized protein n=1 Tax=Sphaerodactylus townsendi TaxID=933632 RepID=A0ACB8EM60_9SAUR